MKRGTPYDVNFRPKLLHKAMAGAFRSASTRHVS